MGSEMCIRDRYNTEMLFENVIDILKTKISYFWIEKMLVKPLVVKTQIVKCSPLVPFSQDASHMYYDRFVGY